MSIVAIVGRPNVGKSTLFNRLVGRRDAIVDLTSGVTRDRHYGKSDWNGMEFSVIDTGGYVHHSDDVFEEEIKKQVRLAVEDADCILFMVDAREGLTGMDEDVADVLRRSKKPVFLVVNKVDSHKQVHEVTEFYRLGVGDLFSISAVSGSGTGELLDAVVAAMPVRTGHAVGTGHAPSVRSEDPASIPHIAIVGRPNAGKSSLVNLLLGSDRTIVTPVPGTTRDSIHSLYKAFGLEFLLIDTAGIRKKGKVSEDIEFYSVMRAIRSIEHSDVCILMVDAERGFESQDINIFSLIQRNHKGVVILVNKWDLIDKETNTHKEFDVLIRDRIAPFRDVPILFTSVIQKQRILKSVETAIEVFQRRSKRISTRVLNDTMLPIIQQHPPPRVKDKLIRIKYVTQLPKPYPIFVFFCNHPQYVKEAYQRFLENQLREKFDFNGVPIEIFFRQK
ncbi:MAG: ribosome biogenesis GTPase Der [Bacteroidales bacterium]|nr:ribosome biogenesis GTPase Der [Deltaproteobacteria bacterium]MBL7138033.1 ribosome biogenesis GTPase Der [Bacteroidales bacterium]